MSTDLVFLYLMNLLSMFLVCNSHYTMQSSIHSVWYIQNVLRNTRDDYPHDTSEQAARALLNVARGKTTFVLTRLKIAHVCRWDRAAQNFRSDFLFLPKKTFWFFLFLNSEMSCPQPWKALQSPRASPCSVCQPSALSPPPHFRFCSICQIRFKECLKCQKFNVSALTVFRVRAKVGLGLGPWG